VSTKQIQRQKLRDEAEAGMEWVGSDIWIGHRIIHTFRLSAHKTKQRLPFGPSALLSSRIRKGSVNNTNTETTNAAFRIQNTSFGAVQAGGYRVYRKNRRCWWSSARMESRLCQYVCNSLASLLRVSPFPIKGSLTRACSAVRSARLP